jgi:xanthine dehydrogenase YagR molybdenum-binding subunit
MHAILGTSPSCIATHTSDLAVALVALDTSIHIQNGTEERLMKLDDFYLVPGDSPDRENQLRPVIGLVVADSFEQARDAAALVKTRYDAEEPVASWEQGLEHSFTPENVNEEKATIKILAQGVQSIDEAFKASPVVIDATYIEPIYHHNPMEPQATTAVWQDDRLTIYDATQGVIAHRLNVAAVLGIDEDMVRVLCPFVGGGFGCKGSMWMFSPLTAAAARTVNRPVKTLLTREQMFTLVGHRPALIQHLTLRAPGCAPGMFALEMRDGRAGR